MPSVARHLAVLGCIAFLFVTSASVTAQNGPPRQILPATRHVAGHGHHSIMSASETLSCSSKSGRD